MNMKPGTVLQHDGRYFAIHTNITIMGRDYLYASEVEPINGQYQPIPVDRTAKTIEIDEKSGNITYVIPGNRIESWFLG